MLTVTVTVKWYFILVFVATLGRLGGTSLRRRQKLIDNMTLLCCKTKSRLVSLNAKGKGHLRTCYSAVYLNTAALYISLGSGS